MVTLVRCQAYTASGAWWGCDQDGSPSILGCGWYLEIKHADNVITRYCHQLRMPLVTVGQMVAPGQVIGMQMRVHGLDQFEVELLDELDITVDLLEHRIDDERFAAAPAGDDIGVSTGHAVEELAEDHR